MENTDTSVTQGANPEVFSEFDQRVHFVGRFTTFLALATMFLPVIVPSIVYGIELNWGHIGAATIGILSAFALNGMIEPFTFAPILGAGATYIAFTTGNVSQTKVPCVVSSQEIMGVEMGTPEGDIVATLAAGVCSLVTTVEVALGMVFVSAIYGFLTSPIVRPGFNNIIPAMMGALTVMRITANPKVGIVPYVVYAGFLLVVGVPFGQKYGIWCMLGLIAITVAWAYLLFKQDIIGPKAKKK